MSYVVLEHTHDEETHVYRLVIGVVETHPQTMVDEEGQALLDEVGEPMTEQVTVVTAVEDFVFSDGDERWEGLDDDEVAEQQMALLKDHLEARDREAGARAAARAEKLRDMPGAGRTL